MISAGHDVEFSGDARGDQATGILNILIDEKIDSTYDNERRRKARQVFHAGRNGAGRHFGGAGGHSQKGRPAKDIGLGGPDEFTDMRRDRTTAPRAVIEHGINE
jgi:hypothetical protein